MKGGESGGGGGEIPLASLPRKCDGVLANNNLSKFVHMTYEARPTDFQNFFHSGHLRPNHGLPTKPNSSDITTQSNGRIKKPKVNWPA